MNPNIKPHEQHSLYRIEARACSCGASGLSVAAYAGGIKDGSDGRPAEPMAVFCPSCMPSAVDCSDLLMITSRNPFLMRGFVLAILKGRLMDLSSQKDAMSSAFTYDIFRPAYHLSVAFGRGGTMLPMFRLGRDWRYGPGYVPVEAAAKWLVDAFISTASGAGYLRVAA